MKIDYADMKLLIETGYSGVLRNVDTDVTPIFEALDIWLPDNGAGAVGLAMQKMIAGEYAEAETLLDEIIAHKPEGKSEAKAIKAMCKALQADMIAAEKLHKELEGEGNSAEALAELIVDENAHEKYEDDEDQNDVGSQEPAHAAAG